MSAPAEAPPPDVAALQERVLRELERLLEHGHGELHVEIDANPQGRVRARVTMGRRW